MPLTVTEGPEKLAPEAPAVSGDAETPGVPEGVDASGWAVVVGLELADAAVVGVGVETFLLPVRQPAVAPAVKISNTATIVKRFRHRANRCLFSSIQAGMDSGRAQHRTRADGIECTSDTSRP
jgi:hypothetical protein